MGILRPGQTFKKQHHGTICHIQWILSNVLLYVLLRNLLDDFSSKTIPNNHPILHLHDTIYSPFSVLLHTMYRFTTCIYKMFLHNIPPKFSILINRVKFHFFFTSTTTIPCDEIFYWKLNLLHRIFSTTLFWFRVWTVMWMEVKILNQTFYLMYSLLSVMQQLKSKTFGEFVQPLK